MTFEDQSWTQMKVQFKRKILVPMVCISLHLKLDQFHFEKWKVEKKMKKN